MSDLIQVTVAGRLTKDAELRQAGEQHVCGFRLAATPYKGEAMFFDVSLWGHRGEALQQYLGRGQQVVVVGGLSQEEWSTNDGEKRTSLRINANEVCLVGSRPVDDGDAEGGSEEADSDGDESVKW